MQLVRPQFIKWHNRYAVIDGTAGGWNDWINLIYSMQHMLVLDDDDDENDDDDDWTKRRTLQLVVTEDSNIRLICR